MWTGVPGFPLPTTFQKEPGLPVLRGSLGKPYNGQAVAGVPSQFFGAPESVIFVGL